MGIFHDRLFFYLPIATSPFSPKQVYFSHDLPYLYVVCFHPPNCFFDCYCNWHSSILVKAPYRDLKSIIAHARIQLAGDIWQIPDHDGIEQASQLRTLRSTVGLSVSPACPLTHSSLDHTRDQEDATSALARVGEVGCMVSRNAY